MTAIDFNAWLSMMRDRGAIRLDRDAATLIGVTDDTLTKFKAKGTDRRTALACAALAAGLEPYKA